MTNEKKFKKLMQDKAFMKKILSMETIEQVQGGFAEHGVDISKNEVEVMGKTIAEIVEKGEALSDDELAKIAAGYSTTRLINIIAQLQHRVLLCIIQENKKNGGEEIEYQVNSKEIQDR